MNFIKLQHQTDLELYNYYAIAILADQGNIDPTEEEINLMERQLTTTYPNQAHFRQVIQSLTLRELIVDVG